MPDSTGDDAVSGENALEPNVIFVGRFEVKVRPRSDVTCSLMAVASPEAPAEAFSRPQRKKVRREKLRRRVITAAESPEPPVTWRTWLLRLFALVAAGRIKNAVLTDFPR